MTVRGSESEQQSAVLASALHSGTCEMIMNVIATASARPGLAAPCALAARVCVRLVVVPRV